MEDMNSNINIKLIYECGSDGKWSKTCVPSYCDNGYIYDSKTNTCIEDICLIKDTDNTDNKKTN